MGTKIMMNRKLLAVCAIFVCEAVVSAQAPPVMPPVMPPAPPAPVIETAAPAIVENFNGEGYDTVGSERFWVTGEYLFGWIQGPKLPPLVTTSPPGTARSAAGVLGSPTTTVLYEGTVNDEVRAGFRFGTGYWFGPQRLIGLEAGFMMLESQSNFFGAASDGSTILARPYLDAITNAQSSVLIGFPGAASGSIQIRSSSGNFYEGHIDIVENAIDEGWFRLNPMIGYRFFRYDEGLRIGQSVLPTDPSIIPGTQISTGDDFTTLNEFHGVDLGVRTQFQWQKLSVGLLGKLAVGKMRNQVNISGGQLVSVPGVAPVAQVGGVYALRSNIGIYNGSEWSLLPEMGCNVGWELSTRVRLTLGYSVMFLQDIARASNQIDPTINPNLLPPAAASASPGRPLFLGELQDIWLQNLSLGMQYTY